MTPLTQTLPQQARAAGTLTLGPAAIPAGYTTADVVLNIADLDYVDPLTAVEALFEWFDGAQWWELGRMSFQGGPGRIRNGVVNPPPRLGVSLRPEMQQARATFNLQQPITAGMSITLT